MGRMMNKKEIILAAFAPALGAAHSPVQVQKLLFIIDKEISGLIGGPYFEFKPYDYGPFDKSLYDELGQLAYEGFVEMNQDRGWRSCSLTVKGQKEGDRLLASLPPEAIKFIGEVSKFVKGKLIC